MLGQRSITVDSKMMCCGVNEDVLFVDRAPNISVKFADSSACRAAEVSVALMPSSSSRIFFSMAARFAVFNGSVDSCIFGEYNIPNT